jgi:hypothetical protein
MVLGASMPIRFTKWGGSPHWHYDLEMLGADRYGTWFGARAGIPMQRGGEPPIRQPHDFVTLVPADGDWIANWNPRSAGNELALYVDVTDRPVLGPDGITAADLDLDVVRLWDGSVRVLDEDEFEEHRIRYGYPPEVIERALAATRDLVTRVSNRDEPFGAVGDAWLASYAGPSPKRA